MQQSQAHPCGDRQAHGFGGFADFSLLSLGNPDLDRLGFHVRTMPGRGIIKQEECSLRYIILAAALLATPATAQQPYALSEPVIASPVPSPPLVCVIYDVILRVSDGATMKGPMKVGENTKTGGAVVELLPGFELKGPLKIEVCDGRVIISKD